MNCVLSSTNHGFRLQPKTFLWISILQNESLQALPTNSSFNQHFCHLTKHHEDWVRQAWVLATSQQSAETTLLPQATKHNPEWHQRLIMLLKASGFQNRRQASLGGGVGVYYMESVNKEWFGNKGKINKRMEETLKRKHQAGESISKKVNVTY